MRVGIADLIFTVSSVCAKGLTVMSAGTCMPWLWLSHCFSAHSLLFWYLELGLWMLLTNASFVSSLKKPF
jgi:hypothetical protein